MSSQVLDGVFAVNKPPTLTSAALCNKIKHILSSSQLFEPYISSQTSLRDSSRSTNSGRLPRSLRGNISVKIGHGGTLDPSASGVVTFGVGNGTKALTLLTKGAEKGYETVVLFGAASDSFDMDGKIVGRKKWDGVTREKVEEALEGFKGRILQRPSVYSALSRGGVRMYEYARAGKDIPELEKREVRVEKLEVVEWYEGGTHDWHWPDKEVEKDKKDAFVKVLRFDEIGDVETVEGSHPVPEEERDDKQNQKGKRKRGDKNNHDNKRTKTEGSEHKDHTNGRGPVADATNTNDTVQQTSDMASNKQSQATTDEVSGLKKADPPVIERCLAPAVRLRMTVSSGFYVRSLCHDLGVAVGSLGLMTYLQRTKQACFELGKNVVEYDDFEKGEDAWGPQVGQALNAWEGQYEQLKKKAAEHGEMEARRRGESRRIMTEVG